MSFSKYLFLFDIDGTLISPGDVSRGLLAKAVTEKTGETVHLGYNDVAGYTDRSIVKNAMLKLNQTITADLLDRIFQHYIFLMKSEFMISTEPFIYQDCIDFLDKVQNAGYAVCFLQVSQKTSAVFFFNSGSMFVETQFRIPLWCSRTPAACVRSRGCARTPEPPRAYRSRGCA